VAVFRVVSAFLAFHGFIGCNCRISDPIDVKGNCIGMAVAADTDRPGGFVGHAVSFRVRRCGIALTEPENNRRDHGASGEFLNFPEGLDS
jgi:hypothetical protein